MKVVVVGAGVIGLCTALSLVRRGHTVTVVDRLPEGADRCSNGNAGMVTPSHFVPLAAPGMVAMGLRMLTNPKGPFRIKPSLSPDLLAWMGRFAMKANARHVDDHAELLTRLNVASRELYAQYEADFGPFAYAQGGILMLAKGEDTLAHEAEMVPRANALGLPTEVVERAHLHEVEPAMTLDVAGGVLFRSDATLIPQSFLLKVSAHLRERGVEFVGAEVRAITKNGVETSAGRLEGDHIVLAAGTWSERLLGHRMPLQPGKGYSFMAQNLPETPTIASILIEARVAVTPMGGAVRFAGTMEVGDWSDRISTPRVEGIVESIPRFYPRLNGLLQPKEVWLGHRPCSPDGIPYIGAVPSRPNLWVGAGHAMMGMSLGPITGEILADSIEGKPTGFDMAKLSPSRFA